MSSSYQGIRATHWSTNLFFDTGDYPATKGEFESESEFEDWRFTNTILALIHCLASLAFLVGVLCGLPIKAFGDVALSFMISWPGAMYTGWLDPSHGQIIGLIVLALVQLAIWTDFFVRTVMRDKWPVWCVATVFLSFTVANFLRIMHWYLRRFLGLGVYGLHHPVRREPNEDALPDEDTLCEEDILEPYNDGLLGSAYRDQLEGTGQGTASPQEDESDDNDANEDEVTSQPRYRDGNRDLSSSPAGKSQPSATIDNWKERPSVVPTCSPPQSQQNPSQTSQQGPRFKQLSFQPRFRWQEKVPDHFRRGLVSLSLWLGMSYLVLEAGCLYMGNHYCNMDLKLVYYVPFLLLPLSWFSLYGMSYLRKSVSRVVLSRLTVTMYMIPWLSVGVITFATIFGLSDAHNSLCVTLDTSEPSDLEQGLCSRCQSHQRVETFLVVSQLFISIAAPVVGMAYCAHWNENRKVGAQVRLARY